ncbi:nuclear transport factor 2 family protein [Micromonospora sp. NPDC005324]|uniref:nuclear transport factor 2 family protein n=1 Tax=Micromonospora sp. NPDC005324 TaxID=3157033 RepID=UPI0033AA67CE
MSAQANTKRPPTHMDQRRQVEASSPTAESKEMTARRLVAFGEAWSNANLEELMKYIADDCVYSASVGPEPGETFRGREEVRMGFIRMLEHDQASESREGPVTVHGTHGTAEWSYVQTLPDGRKVEVRGCDLFEFRGDLITKKDAFRKVIS